MASGWARGFEENMRGAVRALFPRMTVDQQALDVLREKVTDVEYPCTGLLGRGFSSPSIGIVSPLS